MVEADLLLESQQRIQVSMEVTLAGLLGRRAGEQEWEAELAQARYASEESWEHCNAFLFAYTVARQLYSLEPERSIPSNGDYSGFVASFVGCVGRGDADGAISVWTSAPVPNPRASAAAKQTAMLTALIQELRTAGMAGAVVQPFGLPPTYPKAVWIEFTHPAQPAVDVGAEIA